MTRPPALTLFTALLLVGCGPGSDTAEYDVAKAGSQETYTDAAVSKDALIGSWSHSTFLSPQEVAELSDDPIPAGVEVDLTLTGTTTYHLGGRYDADGEVTIRVRQGGQEVPLRLLRREAGTWELHNNILVETVTSGSVNALDETTEAVLDETPEFSAFIEPIAGETASTSIESVTPSSIDLQEQESGIRFTLRRKK